MWTRSLLKKNAWENLKGYYWPAFGVTMLAGIMGANGSGGGFSGGSSYRGSSSSGSSYSGSDYSDSGDSGSADMAIVMFALMIGVVVFFLALAFGTAFSCFVSNPAKCGECKYFVTARNGDEQFGHMFDNFKGGNYMPTVKTMFYYTLEITLWSLLFVIPGIIKSYEYALVPYIVAENPQIDSKRAREISKQTMDGEKWNFFVLRLSFIGWYLLGVMAFCIGEIFVTPYQMATEAEFYMCMRAKMLSFGYTTEEELTGGMFNGMSGSDPSNFSTGSYNEPNFNNNAYNVNSNTNPYQSPSSTAYTGNTSTGYTGTSDTSYSNPGGYVNPNDQYNGQMPGIGDEPNLNYPGGTDTGSDLNNPYNDNNNNPYNQ